MEAIEKVFIRQLDDIVRTILPKPYIRNLGLKENDELEVQYTKDNKIVISKHYGKCIICNSENNLKILNEKPVCLNCIKKLNSL